MYGGNYDTARVETIYRSIAELHTLAVKLVSLTKDPEAGLHAWASSVAKTVQNISDWDVPSNCVDCGEEFAGLTPKGRVCRKKLCARCSTRRTRAKQPVDARREKQRMYQVTCRKKK